MFFWELSSAQIFRKGSQLSSAKNVTSSARSGQLIFSTAQLSYFFERPAERCTNKHYHNYLTLVRQLSNPSSYKMQIS